MELLRKHGLSADATSNDEIAIGLFRDHLDETRQRYAGGDEETYRDADGSEYLSPVEIKAAQIIAGTVKPTLSDDLELYLEVHPKRDDEKFVTYARRVYASLVAAIGGKPIDDLSRGDAHKYVATEIARGVKTGTVSRYMNTIRAIIGTWLREKEIERANPFARVPIPENGGDQAELLIVLRQMAQAFGEVQAVAEQAHLNPPQLYRTPLPKGNPALSSLSAILKAMGMRLAVQPLSTPAQAT